MLVILDIIFHSSNTKTNLTIINLDIPTEIFFEFETYNERLSHRIGFNKANRIYSHIKCIKKMGKLLLIFEAIRKKV